MSEHHGAADALRKVIKAPVNASRAQTAEGKT
jgi:hypothetical protein